jgi:RHS repeat-associated protein
MRRDTASYPGGSDLDYVYDSGFLGSIVHDPASRMQILEVGATQVALYYYNGQSELTWTNLLEPALQNQAGTSSGYPNWDNFNRPISTKWFKSVGGGTDFYDIDVNWDKSGSIVGVVDNLRKSGIGGTRRFDVQYTNDNLGRLLRAQEGSLSGTTLSSPTRDEQWTDGTNSKLSQTGNWLYRRLDLDGDGVFTDLGDENQSSDATFNTVNELTARTFALGTGSGTASTTHTFAYDAVGNQTDDGKSYTYKYDVWGRLKEVWTRGGGAVLKSEYRYNGLGHRTGWHYDVNASGTINGSDAWFYWMYDERWRPIATFRGTDDEPKERFVYHAAGLDGLGGSSYIDAVMLRDRDADTDWDGDDADGDLEERRYICQNWRNDTALVATDAGALVENAKFSGYGNAFNLCAGDIDSDGDYDSTDAAAITGGYDVNKDINMDGSVGAGDLTAADAVTGGYHTEGRGILSADEVFIRKGYAGYEVDPILTGGDGIASLHHIRHRVLSSYTGRWNRRDPLGNVDGAALYEYAQASPQTSRDPQGLLAKACSPFAACGGGGGYQPPTEPQPQSPAPTTPTNPGEWRDWCLDCVSRLIGSDPEIEHLRNLITSLGCTPPTFHCGGPQCNSTRPGYFCCSSNEVHICQPAFPEGSSCTAAKLTIIHELIHSLQKCQLSLIGEPVCNGCAFEGSDCFKCCTEIQAVTGSWPNWCSKTSTEQEAITRANAPNWDVCRRCRDNDPARYEEMILNCQWRCNVH